MVRTFDYHLYYSHAAHADRLREALGPRRAGRPLRVHLRPGRDVRRGRP